MITLLPDVAAPISVSQIELVALNAFNLVWYDARNNEFRTVHDVKAAQILRFLKAFRA